MHAPGSDTVVIANAGLLDAQRTFDEHVQRRDRQAVGDQRFTGTDVAARTIECQCEQLHVRSVAHADDSTWFGGARSSR